MTIYGIQLRSRLRNRKRRMRRSGSVRACGRTKVHRRKRMAARRLKPYVQRIVRHRRKECTLIPLEQILS